MEADPRSPERGQYGFLQDIVRGVAYEMLAKRDRKSSAPRRRRAPARRRSGDRRRAARPPSWPPHYLAARGGGAPGSDAAPAERGRRAGAGAGPRTPGTERARAGRYRHEAPAPLRDRLPHWPGRPGTSRWPSSASSTPAGLANVLARFESGAQRRARAARPRDRPLVADARRSRGAALARQRRRHTAPPASGRSTVVEAGAARLERALAALGQARGDGPGSLEPAARELVPCPRRPRASHADRRPQAVLERAARAGGGAAS